MGFGKYVLGAVGAAGAVIAAPVLVPTMAISTGMAAAAGGVAGIAVGIRQEKKVENAYNEGFNAASKKYEEIFKQQTEEFCNYIKDVEENKKEYDALIAEMLKYIKELEERLERAEGSAEFEKEYENTMDALSRLYDLAA